MSIDRKTINAQQARLVELAIERERPHLEGQVVFITGAARGIGRILAEGLMKAGAKVVCGDLTWAGAESFKESLDQASNTMALTIDIRDEKSIKEAYDAVIKRFGQVDTLINNAALVSETLFAPKGHRKTLDTTAEDWEKMFSVNVFGTLQVIKTFTAGMITRGSGNVLNIVSSGVLVQAMGGGYFAARPWSVEMPYQASKAALTSLTFYLAEELSGSGVSVNAFMPGHTRASWFDATARSFSSEGVTYGLRPMAPPHVLPITLFLTGQAKSSVPGVKVSGRLYMVTDWNYDHGYGGTDTWADYDLPDDMENAYSAIENALPNGMRSGLSQATFDAQRMIAMIAPKVLNNN